MGWRAKLVFVLIVYFAGFATAIYCLGPAPQGKGGSNASPDLVQKMLKSDELAKSVNSGMHKAIDLGKEAAAQAAKLIRQKIDESRAESGG
jgi:zona occludens toxin (predicted ATPase)